MGRERGHRRFVLLFICCALVAALVGPVRDGAVPAPARGSGPATFATDLVSARANAVNAGRRVEAAAERTESTSTYANPDGSYTTEVHAAPVRVERGGQWRPVDLTLERTAEGVVRPKNHPRDLVLAGTAGGHDIAVVRRGTAGAALQWFGALPSPRIAGRDATYPDVRPGIDLVVRATRTGFEQFLVVRERPAAGLSLELGLRADNVTVSRDQDGNTALADGAGATVGVVSAAEMWDARGRGGKFPVAAQRWTEHGAGAFRLTLEPDAASLTNAGARYPMTIGLLVSFDGAVTSVEQPELRIGSQDVGAAPARPYLRFVVDRFADKRIVDAAVSLYATRSPSCTARDWEVWESPPATFGSNQPVATRRVATSSSTRGGGAGCSAGWVSAGVTPLVQKWADEHTPVGAVRLRAASETDPLSYKEFSSPEGDLVPRLEVTYNTPPGATSDHAVSDRSDIGGRVVTRSLTPTLSVHSNDVDGDEQSAVFYVYEGDTIIAAKIVDNVTAGRDARWTVPRGLLADGRSYRFRATSYDDFGVADDSWAVMRSGHDSHLVVQPRDCDLGDDAPIQLAAADGTRCQQIFPQPTGDGHYTLRARHSNRVIEGVHTLENWRLDQAPAGGARVRWFPFAVDTSAPAPRNPDDVQYTYDAAGQLVGVTNQDGDSARYDYDEAGNLRSTPTCPPSRSASRAWCRNVRRPARRSRSPARGSAPSGRTTRCGSAPRRQRSPAPH
jgi:YD repeat-containing protein